MNTNVTDQIKLIMEEFGISAAQLADEIKINRSRISHILTGRNNPSLEITQAILLRYKEINPAWLLFAYEPMFLGQQAENNPAAESNNTATANKKEEVDLFSYKSAIVDDKKTESVTEPQVKQEPIIQNLPQKPAEIQFDMEDQSKIRMITIFYNDKKYENFIPE